MNRAKIVLLLYVLTFLMSAYIKFTRPEKFETNLEIFREVDIIDPSNHALKYKWYSDQNKAKFVYKIYKQIGDTLLARDFSENGIHKISFNKSDKTWTDIITKTDNNRSDVELLFEGNGRHYRILTLKSNEYSVPVIPKNNRFVISSKDFNKILVFRKLPLTGGPVIINFDQVGYSSNSKYIFDKYSINLVDSTFTSFKQTYNSQNPTFEVDYDLSSKVVDIKGNYIETIEEKINLTSEQLVYHSKVFNIQAQGPQSFQITYPLTILKKRQKYQLVFHINKQSLLTNLLINLF